MAKGRFGMCDPPQPGDVYLLRQCGGVLDHANGPPADARIVAGRLQPPSSAQQFSGRTPAEFRAGGAFILDRSRLSSKLTVPLVDFPGSRSHVAVQLLHQQPLATPVVEEVVDARCETRQKLREHVVHVAADLGDVRGVDERAPDRVPDEAVVRIEGDAG